MRGICVDRAPAEAKFRRSWEKVEFEIISAFCVRKGRNV